VIEKEVDEGSGRRVVVLRTRTSGRGRSVIPSAEQYGLWGIMVVS